MNTELNNKIKSTFDHLGYGQSKKIYLKNTDMLRVSRWIKNGLDDRDFAHITVKEATAQPTAWDTCRGTMAYSINLATESDITEKRTIRGLDVGYDGRRAYVVVERGLDLQ